MAVGRSGEGSAGVRAAVCAVVSLVILADPVVAGPLGTPGCLAGSAKARVSAISEALDLVLEDGRTLQLPGLDPIRPTTMQPDGARIAQTTLAHWLVGRAVNVNPSASEPDRWGRTVALAFADPPEDGVPAASSASVGEAMIDAGFARAKVDPAIASCWPIYLALDARARTAGLGLWHDPTYAVANADDTDRLMQRTGMMNVVEGRITSIRMGRTRIYLVFGDRAWSGFSLAVERRIMRRFENAGADVKTWIGKRIRVRGFLDDRFGLQIDLTSLDQVEFIDP